MLNVIRFIGDKIRLYRTAKKLSLRELARRSDTDPSYLLLLERGDVNCSINKLEAICNALNLELADVIPQKDPENELFQKINTLQNEQRALLIQLVEECAKVTERESQDDLLQALKKALLHVSFVTNR